MDCQQDSKLSNSLVAKASVLGREFLLIEEQVSVGGNAVVAGLLQESLPPAVCFDGLRRA